MAKRSQWLLAALLGTLIVHAAHGADRVKANDHPLVGRFQGSDLLGHGTKEFERYRLVTGKVLKASEGPSASQTLEGKLTRAVYQSASDRTTVEVIRAYEASLIAKGMEVIFRCSSVECGGRAFNHAMKSSYQIESGLFGENYGDQRYLTARLPREEGDVYVAIYTVKNTSSGGPQKDKINTLVEVVEVRPMQGKIEVVTADKMALDISTQGRVALYGIYFDTGKADIKADSAPALEEVAKLLRAHPALRLHVVGHTDNQGTLPFNLDLSKRRAEAVVLALSDRYGIGTGRLAAHGVAFLAPVASNNSEPGRARNRRVELSEP